MGDAGPPVPLVELEGAHRVDVEAAVAVVVEEGDAVPARLDEVPLGGTAAERLLRELAPHRVEAHRVVAGRARPPWAPPPVAVPWPWRGHRRRAPRPSRLAPGEAALEHELHARAPAQAVAHSIEHRKVRIRRVARRVAAGPGFEPGRGALQGVALGGGEPGRGLDQGLDPPGRLPEMARERGHVAAGSGPDAVAQPFDRLLVDLNGPRPIGVRGLGRPGGAPPSQTGTSSAAIQGLRRPSRSVPARHSLLRRAPRGSSPSAPGSAGRRSPGAPVAFAAFSARAGRRGRAGTAPWRSPATRSTTRDRCSIACS